jgi:hypothetical protein
MTSLACGLMPALQARRVNLVESLSEDGIAPAGATMRSRTARADDDYVRPGRRGGLH